MNDYTADVLIVGAGPTGLSLANALTQLDVSVMLIEARDSISKYTKATNLMQGTLEQLSIYDLSSVMYDKGGKMSRYMIGLYGSNVSPREMHLSESPHSNVLFLGQDLIDGNLADKFLSTGNLINFNHRLTGLEQNSTSVKARIDNQHSIKDYVFKYVVGCDGPRSTTREFTSCNFEPVKTGKYVWQVDANLKWKRLKTMKQMWLYYYDNGFGAVIHLPNNVTKVMVFEPKGNLANRNPTLQEMEEKLRKMSGDETSTLSNPIWLSHGELLTGVAPSLIDSRVILAGDSCNPILPNGGQGLNIGIQDSLNLAWKLSDVIKGYASEALLLTYDEERRKVRLELEEIQINTLKYTLPAPKINQWILKNFGNYLLNKYWIKLARLFSQLTLSYKDSLLTKELINKRGISAGHRILDADIVQASSDTEVSLFKKLSTPRWKLLMFDNGNQVKTSELFFDSKYDFIDKYIITSSLSSNYHQEILYYDIDDVAHKTYQVTEAQYLLIRPDNYVGLRVGVRDSAKISEYLNQWFILK